MDHFMEEVVTKKNRVLDEVVYYLSLVLMGVSGLFALIDFSGITAAIPRGIPFTDLIPDIVLTIVAAATAVLIFLFRDRLRTEYEYTFTNGDLDFAEVYNNKKRKSLGTLKVRTVEAFGPVNGSAFQRYISMQDVKQSRWFLNRGANLYYFFFQKEGNKRVIVLEPSDELVDMIRRYLPHGAYQE